MSSEDEDNSQEWEDWEKLETIKTFDVADEITPLSKLLQNTSIDASHCDSSTKLIDNTTNIKDDFIESITTKATAPVSLLVESLVQQLCTMIDPDPVRSEKLYSTICMQLHRMNLIDETYLMGEFDVMRSQYQRALYQLATVARGQPEIPINLQSVWPLTDSIGMSWSRYHREFDELSFIAGGGFGRVYRARHKLDGIDYAVKKITIKYRTINRVLSHLAEVKTFASLNHTNIVPYKAAWLEPLFDNASNRPSVTAASHGTRSKKKTKIVALNEVKVNKLPMVVLDVDADHDFPEYNENDESDSDTDTSESDETTASHQNLKVSNRKLLAENKNCLRPPTINNADESSDFIQFEQNTIDDMVDGASMSHQATAHTSASARKRKGKRSRKALCKHSQLNNENNNRIKSDLDFNGSQPHLKLKWATLYIQMSFRPLTLRAWLDDRNRHSDFNEFFKKFLRKSVSEVNPINEKGADGGVTSESAMTTVNRRQHLSRRRQSTTSSAIEECLAKDWSSMDVAIDIFTQVLNGLNYIHMQNIVHHDIKPSNIFIGCEKNGKLYVQLGDFGLACPLQAKHSPDGMIGTLTYAAPEQLAGQCNPKSDLFSLGIILLELLVPFNTDMERMKNIENARKGIFPDHLPSQFLTLLNRLLQHHKKRPDTSQLWNLLPKLNLYADSHCEKTNESTPTQRCDLKQQLNELTSELNTLKMQMSSQENNDLHHSATSTEFEAYQCQSHFHQSSISPTSLNTSDSMFSKDNENCMENNNNIIKLSTAAHIVQTKSTQSELNSTIAAINDKDQLIEYLQNELLEKNREKNDMEMEIMRLRELLQSQNITNAPDH